MWKRARREQESGEGSREKLIHLLDTMLDILETDPAVCDEVEEWVRVTDLDACKEALQTAMLLEQYTHCTTCGVDMSEDPSHVDWEAVHGSSDPCDDCCCGSCGVRKAYPGQAHC